MITADFNPDIIHLPPETRAHIYKILKHELVHYRIFSLFNFKSKISLDFDEALLIGRCEYEMPDKPSFFWLLKIIFADLIQHGYDLIYSFQLIFSICNLLKNIKMFFRHFFLKRTKNINIKK